ncbi:hypothetical protein NE236_26740 [Actinoallomurus purpureus]|uniref:hypothetical protein n=1 Tax=Actinoallomurus purpureus TaxID=478114 RepID=UPI00209248C2|nr:hypothetical protein [Actinoallomurus purpureus]MCO6008575.1 hypothetical protein [Actinoallomurus purpureus]
MNYEELHHLITSGAAEGPVFAWAAETLRKVDSRLLRVNAVLHPLGFICLPLQRHGLLGVCLHLWPADRGPSDDLGPSDPGPPATSQIHCHSWELLSLVLYGQVTNQRIRLDDGHDLRVFEVRSSGDEDDVRPTARTVRATPESSDVHGPGDAYGLPSGVFHRTSVADGAATIALGRTVPAGQDLSVGPPDLGRHRMRRRHCPPRELSDAVRLAAARLDQSSLR